MRKHINLVSSLVEAKVDFVHSSMDVSENRNGHPVYKFKIPVLGGNATIFATATIDDRYANLDLVTTMDDGDVHPEMFYTNTHPDAPGEYGIGVKIGTSEMRRILRYIVTAVRKDHPEVDRLAGWRATGARGFNMSSNPNMSLKV